MGAKERAVIDKIRREYSVDENDKVPQDRNNDALKRTVALLAKTINSDLGHFILELVQNADDVKYAQGVTPTLEFELFGNYLIVSKNENGFTEQDVNSICDIGNSTKILDDKATGEKGIGFKSVFKAGVKVTICSNGYEFSFDKRRDCGMLIPKNGGFPAPLAHLRDASKTQFIIELENDKVVAGMRQDLMHRLDASILLFLRCLKVVEIRHGDSHRRLVRSAVDKIGYQELVLSTTSTMGKTLQEFLLFDKSVPVTPLLDTHKTSKETSTVAIALPLAAFGKSGEQKKQDAFCWLPIRQSDLPFPIQAHFRLTASREDLDWCDDMGLRNKELLDGIADLFLDAVVVINENADLRYKWMSLLPINNPESSFVRVAEQIKARIGFKPVFFAQNGKKKLQAAAARFVPEQLRHNNQPLVPSLDPKVDNLHTGYILSTETLKWLNIDPISSTMFLEMFKSFVAYEGGISFQKRPNEWHESIAVVLKEYPRTVFENLQIVPVDVGKWINPGPQIHFPPSKDLDQMSKTVLQSLPNMDFVSRVAMAGPRRIFLEHLGVKNIDVRRICAAIEDAHTINEPPSKNPDILLSHAQYMYKHRNNKKKISETGKVSLWMATQTLKAARSASLYFNDTDAEIQMSLILPSSMQDRLLHPNYISAVQGIDSHEWLEWLRDIYQVAGRLHIVEEGHISNDLIQVAESTSSCHWLKVLMCEWKQVEKAKTKDRDAAQVLRVGDFSLTDTHVDAVDGTKAPLRDMYLPTEDLLNMRDGTIKFLKIENPSNPIWRPLHELGVVCTTNEVDHVLKALRGMKHDGKTDLDGLRRMYSNLGKLLGTRNAMDEHLATVRAFFRDEAHIWDPEKSCWRTVADCVWAGDFKLAFKFQVDGAYSSSQALFKDLLNIKDTDVEEVLKDIAARPDPENASDVPRMIELLKELVKYITKQGKDEAVRQFKQVKRTHEEVLKKGLIPIKVPVFERVAVPKGKPDNSSRSSTEDPEAEEQTTRKKLIRTDLEFWGLARMEMYLVCDRVAWEKSFNRVKVVDCSAEDGCALTPMFDTMIAAFNSKPKFVRMMSLRVKERPHPGRGTVLDAQTTNRLRPKMVLISRVVEHYTTTPSDVQKEKLRVLDKIEIHSSPHIEVQPFIILQGTNQFEHYGIARKGGQFLPPQAYQEGRFEIYADRARIDNQVSFIYQLHKDLVEWLAITSPYIKEYMREIFASEERNVMIESLRLAGINMDALPIPDIAKASATDLFTPQPNGHHAKNGSFPSESGVNGIGATHGESSATGGYASNMVPASDAIPVTSERAQELADAAGAFQETIKKVKASIAAPHQVRSSFFTGVTHEGFEKKISADPEAGLDGELFVFKLLTKVLRLDANKQPGICRAIWTSELRHKGESDLGKWIPKDMSRPYADFTVMDKLGLLSKWLAINGVENSGRNTTYHIEVKSSKGGVQEEFHMSDSQMTFARDVSVNRRGKETYLIFRVYDLSTKPAVKVLADPWKKFAFSEVEFRAREGWTGKIEA